MKASALKLRCRDGHWEWGTFTLHELPGGSVGLVAPCDLGDHWLAEDVPSGRIAVRAFPYAWRSAREAAVALIRYEQQEGQVSARE